MNNLKRFILTVMASVTIGFAFAQSKTTVAKNVGSLSWEKNVSINKSQFKDATEGSLLYISAAQTKADYHKFKVYAVGNGWQELGKGGVSGASFANGELTLEKSSSTITITLTNQDAQNLKSGGMILHGFGVSVKTIELSASAKQSGSSKQQTSSGQTTSAGTTSSKSAALFDLGNWQNFAIPSSAFANSANYAIKISTAKSASQSNPSYFNMKLYIADNWAPVYKGSLTSSQDVRLQGDLIVLSKAENTFTYTPTASERQEIAKKGLRIQGYGMSVTEVSVVYSSGTASASTTPASSGTTASSSTTTASSTTSSSSAPAAVKGTPFANHGKLHVSGAYLYDSKNQKYQLYGMSTHGLSWFPEYVSKESFATLRDDWNTNCVRLVLYPGDYNGYCNGGNKEELKKVVYKGIDEATALGMYVIVDWHIHNDNPNKYKSEAKIFLDEVSKKYANYGNVLYEICNEPVNADWNSQIKPYAEEIIPVIRKNAPDAIIIVGTNTWSQDVDKAAANPIKNYGNIMYTFHFYAHTHTASFRTKVENAINAGLPIFITEFGTCDASGNGGYDASQTKIWFDLVKKYNLSHMNWSLCNKAETASVILPGCSKKSGWQESDLTESGKLIRSHFKSLSR